MQRLTIIGFIFLLAGCQTTTGNLSCAGWKEINMKAQTAYYIADNDIDLGKKITSHNQYGKSLKCWK